MLQGVTIFEILSSLMCKISARGYLFLKSERQSTVAFYMSMQPAKLATFSLPLGADPISVKDLFAPIGSSKSL